MGWGAGIPNDPNCKACGGRSFLIKVPSAQIDHPSCLGPGQVPEKAFVRCWECHVPGVGFRPVVLR